MLKLAGLVTGRDAAYANLPRHRNQASSTLGGFRVEFVFILLLGGGGEGDV